MIESEINIFFGQTGIKFLIFRSQICIFLFCVRRRTEVGMGTVSLDVAISMTRIGIEHKKILKLF